MKRIPTIVHEHANLTATPWFQQAADAMLEPITDIAIAVSRSTADFLVSARKIPANKVKVVYLGVPLEEFSRPRSAEEIADARRELGLAPEDFAVGTVTRLHDSKGNSFLVSAARLVLDRRPQARFFVVGEGPLRADLEHQAQQLGLGDRFIFSGFARDVARVVSASDPASFRRCGRERRSRCSKRLQWEDHSRDRRRWSRGRSRPSTTRSSCPNGTRRFLRPASCG